MALAPGPWCFGVKSQLTAVASILSRPYQARNANPFPDFKAEGSFSSRTYTFYAGLGDKIARVSRGQEAFRDVDTYQVEVAAGVDAAAVLAMAVIIDEDHDEMDDKEREQESGSVNQWLRSCVVASPRALRLVWSIRWRIA